MTKKKKTNKSVDHTSPAPTTATTTATTTKTATTTTTTTATTTTGRTSTHSLSPAAIAAAALRIRKARNSKQTVVKGEAGHRKPQHRRQRDGSNGTLTSEVLSEAIDDYFRQTQVLTWFKRELKSLTERSYLPYNPYLTLLDAASNRAWEEHLRSSQISVKLNGKLKRHPAVPQCYSIQDDLGWDVCGLKAHLRVTDFSVLYRCRTVLEAIEGSWYACVKSTLPFEVLTGVLYPTFMGINNPSSKHTLLLFSDCVMRGIEPSDATKVLATLLARFITQHSQSNTTSVVFVHAGEFTLLPADVMEEENQAYLGYLLQQKTPIVLECVRKSQADGSVLWYKIRINLHVAPNQMQSQMEFSTGTPFDSLRAGVFLQKEALSKYVSLFEPLGDKRLIPLPVSLLRRGKVSASSPQWTSGKLFAMMYVAEADENTSSDSLVFSVCSSFLRSPLAEIEGCLSKTELFQYLLKLDENFLAAPLTQSFFALLKQIIASVLTQFDHHLLKIIFALVQRELACMEEQPPQALHHPLWKIHALLGFAHKIMLQVCAPLLQHMGAAHTRARKSTMFALATDPLGQLADESHGHSRKQGVTNHAPEIVAGIISPITSPLGLTQQWFGSSLFDDSTVMDETSADIGGSQDIFTFDTQQQQQQQQQHGVGLARAATERADSTLNVSFRTALRGSFEGRFVGAGEDGRNLESEVEQTRGDGEDGMLTQQGVHSVAVNPSATACSLLESSPMGLPTTQRHQEQQQQQHTHSQSPHAISHEDMHDLQILCQIALSQLRTEDVKRFCKGLIVDSVAWGLNDHLCIDVQKMVQQSRMHASIQRSMVLTRYFVDAHLHTFLADFAFKVASPTVLHTNPFLALQRMLAERAWQMEMKDKSDESLRNALLRVDPKPTLTQGIYEHQHVPLFGSKRPLMLLQGTKGQAILESVLKCTTSSHSITHMEIISCAWVEGSRIAQYSIVSNLIFFEFREHYHIKSSHRGKALEQFCAELTRILLATPCTENFFIHGVGLPSGFWTIAEIEGNGQDFQAALRYEFHTRESVPVRYLEWHDTHYVQTMKYITLSIASPAGSWLLCPDASMFALDLATGVYPTLDNAKAGARLRLLLSNQSESGRVQGGSGLEAGARVLTQKKHMEYAVRSRIESCIENLQYTQLCGTLAQRVCLLGDWEDIPALFRVYKSVVFAVDTVQGMLRTWVAFQSDQDLLMDVATRSARTRLCQQEQQQHLQASPGRKGASPRRLSTVDTGDGVGRRFADSSSHPAAFRLDEAVAFSSEGDIQRHQGHDDDAIDPERLGEEAQHVLVRMRKRAWAHLYKTVLLLEHVLHCKMLQCPPSFRRKILSEIGRVGAAMEMQAVRDIYNELDVLREVAAYQFVHIEKGLMNTVKVTIAEHKSAAL